MRDTETKQRFVELRASGISFAKIANELNTSKQTLIGWSKELKQEITNLRAIGYEELCEKHLIAREHRIRALGASLQKIVAEIENRDFSEIPTDKLVDSLLKVGNAARQEEEKVVFSDDPLSGLSLDSSWTV